MATILKIRKEKTNPFIHIPESCQHAPSFDDEQLLEIPPHNVFFSISARQKATYKAPNFKNPTWVQKCAIAHHPSLFLYSPSCLDSSGTLRECKACFISSIAKRQSVNVYIYIQREREREREREYVNEEDDKLPCYKKMANIPLSPFLFLFLEPS